MKIAILEDDARRIAEMTRCLAACLPACEIVYFDNAPDMIAWLKLHREELSAIGLDHDLGPNRFRAGAIFDPGTGRDVADFLASCAPVCPILIHTTNALAAPGMECVLNDSGWHQSRIVPYGDLEWIDEIWVKKMEKIVWKHVGKTKQ
jgi:hypothetical protein